MRFDFFGERTEGKHFNLFVDYLSKLPHNGWQYMGMNVELDPTVDYKNETVKVRWTDLDEGFNDKIIIRTKEEFLEHFSRIE